MTKITSKQIAQEFIKRTNLKISKQQLADILDEEASCEYVILDNKADSGVCLFSQSHSSCDGLRFTMNISSLDEIVEANKKARSSDVA